MPATRTIKVLRPFFYEGKPVKVGDTLEVNAVFAAELITVRKAEAVASKPAPAPETPDKPAAPAKAGKDAR